MNLRKISLKEETFISAIGIAVEYYNVFVFGYLSAIIIPEFFPKSIQCGLFWTIYLILLVAFPILGSIVCGHISDKYGRKKILAWTVAFVSIPSFVISILPTYDHWGVYAAVIFSVFRLIQIFAFGGDMVGLLTFVLEEVPNDKGLTKYERGKYGGYMSCGAGLGVAFATLGIAIIYPDSCISATSCKWRTLMCIGGVGIFIAAYFHVRIHETKTFKHYKEHFYQKAIPIKDLLQKDWLGFIQVVGMTTLVPIITIIIFAFFPYHVGIAHGLHPRLVMLSLMGSLIVFSIFAPIFGAISDRIGRKLVLQFVAATYLVFASYLLMFVETIDLKTYLTLQVVFIFISSAYYGVTFAASSETFPTHIRFSGVSISYAVTYVIFGEAFGFYVTEFLENGVNISSFAPFLYLILGCAIVFFTMAMKKETAFKPLHDRVIKHHNH